MIRELIPTTGAACLVLLGAAMPACAADNSTGDTEKIDGFRNTPMIPGTKWHLHDPDRPQPAVVTPGATFSQGAPAPSDAEVLFDGKDLSKWQNNRGQDAHWKVADGYVETAARGGGIRTRGKWADFQLHVEWAAPNPPRGSGQGRGNSGVLINGMYEVQVLDSYKAKTYPDGQAGAIYGQSPPLVNASKPPASGKPTTSSSNRRAGMKKGSWSRKPASPCCTMGSLCRTTMSSAARPTASARQCPGGRSRSMLGRIRRKSSSSCRITTTRCATAISGFASWADRTNRERGNGL